MDNNVNLLLKAMLHFFQRIQTNKNPDGNVSEAEDTKSKNTPHPGMVFPNDNKRVSYSPHMSRYSPSKQQPKISNGGYSNATSAVSSRTVLQALGMKVNGYDHSKVQTKIIRLNGIGLMRSYLCIFCTNPCHLDWRSSFGQRN